MSEWPAWQPIETAPRDGSAVLGYGVHTGSPSTAQFGVVAGDHWWAIMLFDVWRSDRPSHWVFAKDGERTWSEPTHWMPLTEPPATTGPDWDALRGCAPDATGNLPSEVFVRGIRSDWE